MDGKPIEKKRLLQILNVLDDPIILLGKDFTVIYSNEMANSLFKDGLGGKKITEIFPSERFVTFLKSKKNTEGGDYRTYIYKSHIGHDAIVKGKGREHVYRINVKKIAENTLLILKNITKEEKLLMVRQDFIANASHELKTPLTAIAGFAETLGDENLSKEEVKYFSSIIYKNSTRMESILSDLLLLTSLERSDIAPTFEQIDALDIINEAVGFSDFKAEERKIKLIIEKSESKLRGNKSLLVQALINLITNAITYSDEKSKVFISSSQNQMFIDISVRDLGVGISKEDQERIFERFYRVDKARSRNSGGTGLGLSIVRHIALLHGGTVQLESELGKGSTFTLHIPRE